MSVFYNPDLIKDLKGYLVPDTNVLSSCISNPLFFGEFIKITQNTTILIDPIVKLEFKRGAYQEHLLKEKQKFLEYEGFNPMMDHQRIHMDTADRALDVSRVYCHHGKTNMPLGDLLIIARMSIYKRPIIFATLDKDDFTPLLFDRIGIATFVREIAGKQGKTDVIEVIQFLSFNHDRFTKYLDRLPK